MLIHPTAIIDSSVKLGENVKVGSYAIIEQDVEIGDGCQLHAHAIIKRNTRIGQRNIIHEHAIIGGDPQDLSYNGDQTSLVIGDDNVFRECVTVHRATKREHPTTIGNSCFLMAYSHVAHDCQLEDNIIFANNATLGGHVKVGKGAFISGSTAVHQFCQVGAYSMLSGVTPVSLDALPFMIIAGNPARTIGLNLVGLKRADFNKEEISHIKQAFQILFLSGKPLSIALEELKTIDSVRVKILIDFINHSKRGFTHYRKKQGSHQNTIRG